MIIGLFHLLCFINLLKALEKCNEEITVLIMLPTSTIYSKTKIAQ